MTLAMPASDVDTVEADSLKVLDPKRQIREADTPAKSHFAPPHH
jgi:hypothetical protein